VVWGQESNKKRTICGKKEQGKDLTKYEGRIVYGESVTGI